MPRKRLTQLFPALIPLRRWERKKLFYLKMRLDGNHYAASVSPTPLPFQLFETSEVMVNPNTGCDIIYQYNKVHNLALAARRVSGVLIKPGETFSFWRLVKDADRDEPYKDGLVLVNGKIVSAYGGGLCQLSNLLYLCILHSPLTVTERHGHPVEGLPPNAGESLHGVDATVNEGWLDLRARNDTGNTFQLLVEVGETEIQARILALTPVGKVCAIRNPSIRYCRKDGKIYEYAEVSRTETDTATGEEAERHLYTNICQITYPLPADTVITEEREENE